MKHLDFPVTDHGRSIDVDKMLGATLTVDLPDDEKLEVVIKMLHSNNTKATAYNVERRVCAFLEKTLHKGWICSSLFHIPPMPNEPAPKITVIHMNANTNADPRPQPDPAAV